MQGLFSYVKRNSPVHRLPAGLKIILLFAIPITVSLTPLWVCLSVMGASLLMVLLARIPISFFLRDLRPIIWYCFMLCVIDLMSFFFFGTTDRAIRDETIALILRLLCAMEVTSVFFRTTSTFQIRESLMAAEKAITFGHSSMVISGSFALFLSFLPSIFLTWSHLDQAYRARGGKAGIRKVVRLLPLWIAMSIRKAGTTWLALLNRSSCGSFEAGEI